MTGWFKDFEERRFAVNGAEIAARLGGDRDKPALMLLHGFPQTHAMWHRVAQLLRHDFFLVLPDLRGYGDSSHAPGLPDHSNYSKRALAQDLIAVMDTLGIAAFALCGHDRGGRVAHRLALDHPARVRRLCVIDIAPTLDMYARTDFDFARAYYHWFHLIQPTPLPELGHIEPRALAEYERCFCRDEAIHTACEDYRASAGIDLEHDRESRARGHKIACDTLMLWGEHGVVQRLFDPLALWQAQCAGAVTGWAMPAGHFIPEQLPDETAAALQAFMD